MSAAVARLNKTREERDQFDEASNQIVVHLKAKVSDYSLISVLFSAWKFLGKYVEPYHFKDLRNVQIDLRFVSP